jgi:ribosomal protein S18 acetylase RimI-like enzyme
MELERVGGVRIVRVASPEDVREWRPAFIGAYQTVFSAAPYYEKFYPSEAEGIYRKLTRTPDNITLLAVDDSKVVGFGVAIPLRFKPDVERELSGLVNADRAMYMAELGVLEEYRQKGLGNTLIRKRIQLIDPKRYTDVVLRVSATRNVSYAQYLKMGFEDMGVYMEVKSLRTDGRVTTDRRLFLHQTLNRLLAHQR